MESQREAPRIFEPDILDLNPEPRSLAYGFIPLIPKLVQTAQRSKSPSSCLPVLHNIPALHEPRTYGRNYYARYDYEGSAQALKKGRFASSSKQQRERHTHDPCANKTCTPAIYMYDVFDVFFVPTGVDKAKAEQMMKMMSDKSGINPSCRACCGSMLSDTYESFHAW